MGNLAKAVKPPKAAPLAKQPGGDSIEEWLKKELPAKLAEVLPKHLTPERVVRIALMAMLKTPALRTCTKMSLVQCILNCSSMGIEPDGRRAHLIPFNDRKSGLTICTLIIDYKGMVELVRRSGEVSDIHSDVVCENDHFEHQYGSGSHLVHKPALKRGKVLAAYSYVKLRDGSESFEVMSAEEIEAIRKRSKAANFGPWVTDWSEMAKKTVFRRHGKWLPFSSDIRQVIEADDDNMVKQPAAVVAQPFNNLVPLPSRSTEPKQLPADVDQDGVVQGDTEDQQAASVESAAATMESAGDVPPEEPAQAPFPEEENPPHSLTIPDKDMLVEGGAVESVEDKQGEKAGRKYTRYIVTVNNTQMATFDKKLADNARWYERNNVAVAAYYTEGKYGKTLEHVEAQDNG
jgi:recombination protein RecT